MSHLRTDGMGKALRRRPGYGAPALRQGCDNMQAFTPRGFAKSLEANRLETVPHLIRRIDHPREGHLRTGIQIKHQAPRDFWLPWQAIPRMNFQGAHLGNRRQCFEPVDLHIRCFVPLYSDERQ